MNLSAILVITAAAEVEACMAMLASLAGIIVHHSDPVTGKIMLTQEAESIDAEIEGLKRIKSLSGVAMAEMVYHYFEEDDALEQRIPAELDSFQGLGELPEFLKNNAN